MCLITKKPIKIATKDIVVYKVLNENMVSPHFSFTYKLNKEYSSEIKFDNDWSTVDKISTEIVKKIALSKNLKVSCFIVEKENLIKIGFNCYGKGRHSFKTFERAYKSVITSSYDESQLIVKGIIPKGAEYIVGEDECVISNKIILTEIIDN